MGARSQQLEERLARPWRAAFRDVWPPSGIRALAVGECVAEGGASEESGFRVSGGGSCS